MAGSSVRRLEDLVAAAQAAGPVSLAVAAPEDREVLLAVVDAYRAGIAVPCLFGEADRIQRIADREGIDLSGIEERVVNIPAEGGGRIEAARRAVEMARRGDAGVLMKGKVDTADLMRAVLARETGLRSGRLLSHVALIEVPVLDRLLYITDGGVVLTPSLDQKAEIIRNAVAVAHSLGLEMPRVAVLAASEAVNAELPTTIEAAALSKMAERGQISGALVDGPLGLDNAVSAAAAETKGVPGPVAGRADILLVPNVDAGNLMAKAMTFLAGGRMAGIVVGASVPIVITSRADPREGKLFSIALATVMASAQGWAGGKPIGEGSSLALPGQRKLADGTDARPTG